MLINQSQKERKTGKGMLNVEVEWEEKRYEGVLVCLVDRANPTHLKILSRLHGKKEWVEIWTVPPKPKGIKT